MKMNFLKFCILIIATFIITDSRAEYVNSEPDLRLLSSEEKFDLSIDERPCGNYQEYELFTEESFSNQNCLFWKPFTSMNYSLLKNENLENKKGEKL